MTDIRRFAVLGDPIAHSRSPAMHAAAYRALDLPHTYEALRVPNDELGMRVRELRAGVFSGFNVTVPHKRRILDFVDVVEPSAALVGAANTLVLDDVGVLHAHNTDVPALAEELVALAPERGAGEHVRRGWAGGRGLVIGSGGAARSAVIALAAELGVGVVHVRARAFDDRGKAEAFAGEMRALLRDVAPCEVIAEPLRADAEIDATLDAIVQATSAGMHGAEPGDVVADAVSWSELAPRAVALEVIYAPPETPFLRAAAAHGIRAANGFGMLARQGALAFELWLGMPAPYNAMLAALL
jgi:shikimate dehydrogenase